MQDQRKQAGAARAVRRLAQGLAAAAALAAAALAHAQQAGKAGEAACKDCHATYEKHYSATRHASSFRLNPRTGLERRGCEACHGPAAAREDRLKVGYVNRSVGLGTLRASAEYGSRRGPGYEGDVYHDFLAASLGTTPATGNVASWIHVLSSFRKYDLADRDQAVVNARYNTALADTLDGPH